MVAGDLEAVGVEPKLVEDGGVDVGDVVAVFDGVEAELVGGTVDAVLSAGLYRRKSLGMPSFSSPIGGLEIRI